MCGMCCTLRPAQLSQTILYAGEAMHAGKHVHVLGYQNRSRNMFTGPNAMILPFPSFKEMGPENCLETKDLKWMMKNMADAVQPPIQEFSKSRRSMGSVRLGSSRVITFESGAYTVVLADDAISIPAALDKVPEQRRPQINEEIFEAYSKWYPEWPIALCCFDSRQEVANDPMIWWYEPTDKETLFAPALDAHLGRAPDLSQKVAVDHTVIFGSTETPRGATVRFNKAVPSHIYPFIPNRVVGKSFKTVMSNGDFTVPLERLTNISARNSSADVKISRSLPPGAMSNAGAS